MAEKPKTVDMVYIGKRLHDEKIMHGFVEKKEIEKEGKVIWFTTVKHCVVGESYVVQKTKDGFQISMQPEQSKKQIEVKPNIVDSWELSSLAAQSRYVAHRNRVKMSNRFKKDHRLVQQLQLVHEEFKKLKNFEDKSNFLEMVKRVVRKGEV